MDKPAPSRDELRREYQQLKEDFPSADHSVFDKVMEEAESTWRRIDELKRRNPSAQ